MEYALFVMIQLICTTAHGQMVDSQWDSATRWRHTQIDFFIQNAYLRQTN